MKQGNHHNIIPTASLPHWIQQILASNSSTGLRPCLPKFLPNTVLLVKVLLWWWCVLWLLLFGLLLLFSGMVVFLIPSISSCAAITSFSECSVFQTEGKRAMSRLRRTTIDERHADSCLSKKKRRKKK